MCTIDSMSQSNVVSYPGPQEIKHTSAEQANDSHVPHFDAFPKTGSSVKIQGGKYSSRPQPPILSQAPEIGMRHQQNQDKTYYLFRLQGEQRRTPLRGKTGELVSASTGVARAVTVSDVLSNHYAIGDSESSP